MTVKMVNRLVTLALTLACALAAPLPTVAEPAMSASPEWSFSGVSLSASRVTSGEPVTVTPQVTGDLDGATYNYVWSFGGGWDLWGSTVRDTGSGTSDAKGTLTLTKAGTYTIYVDVTDRAGERRTMSAALEVAPPSWSFSGVRLSATRVTSGQSVTVTPVTSGDFEGATYNYVWQRDGSWAEGDWGSTVKDTGRGTPDSSSALTLTRAGSYTIYVDVTDRSGRKRTMSATLEVSPPSWSFSDVRLSASRVTSGEPVTVTPEVSGDLDGATYNYVWSYGGGWDLWGSTVRDIGRGTGEASSALTLTRAGSYTLYVDVTDRSGQKRTMSATLEVSPPSWSFAGVVVSSPRVRVDEPVTVTPVTSGDLDGASYNYVWSYQGGWDLWGSTVRDEGKPTAEAAGTLSFSRPGRYVLYVDVTDRSGRKRTMSAEVEAYDDSWSLDGVDVSSASVPAGGDVTYAPRVSGDASGLRYNYVWQWEGSWAEGDWGSTELYTGSDTAEASHAGALGTPGRYTLYVDAVSERGERRTASAEVVAWGITGIDVSSPDGGLTWKASAVSLEVPPDAIMEYRFRWETADGSASGTLSDWSSAASCSFRRSDFGNLSSQYRIHLDVRYPSGKMSTYALSNISLLSYAQKRVITSACDTPSVGAGYCSEWVDNVFVNAGYYRYGKDKNANDLCREYCMYTKLSDLQPGMIIAVEKSPTRLGRIYGHVAIYIGNGKVHDDEGYIREMSLADWLSYYSKVDTPRWGWYGNIPLA